MSRSTAIIRNFFLRKRTITPARAEFSRPDRRRRKFFHMPDCANTIAENVAAPRACDPNRPERTDAGGDRAHFNAQPISKAPLRLSPAAIGVGLKAPHYNEALNQPHEIEFFEIHAENFMGDGGPPHRWLSAFCAQFPLSIHGVCLSIGGRDQLNKDHLNRLAILVDRYRPALVSEHLAWSSDGGHCYNDLLPPPLTALSLARTCDHVNEAQDRLGRQILIENPSRYLRPVGDALSEPDFLNELARRTNCGLLLDINNVFVSAANVAFSAEEYIDAINAGAVAEIHLAGHAVDQFDGATILVDNHGAPVSRDVMTLFERFARANGPRPTLVEWDTNIPPFTTLAAQAIAARFAMSTTQRAREADDAA